MKFKLIRFGLLMVALIGGGYSIGECQSDNGASPGQADNQLTLTQYIMCETIDELEPKNPAIIFSIDVEKVTCYTSFDPVPENTVIFHNWFRRDVLNTKIKLSLKPPRWRTYSNIQLRETDKGPWRVEITDADGHILGTIRFSITD